MPVADSDVVEALLEDAHPAATLHLADLEHPWLGLESFREETRAYFFGRDTEIAELHLRLRSHPLLVLYGRSGLGKTSILMAGLIPRLRAEEQRPLLLRFRYEDPALDVCGQLVSAVFGWGDGQGGPVGLKPRPTKSLLWTGRLAEKLNLLLPDDLPSRLWLWLHYRAEPPDITHLILDQFEEVFTLGARRAGTEHEVRDALAIILQGAIPEPISRLIAEHDVFLDHFDPDSMPVRVILALRDDYVYALNRWKRHLPALGQNNFELRALRGPAAFDAVFKPGELRCKYRGAISEQDKVDTGLPPIVSNDTAERIVRFIARKDEDVALEEIEAVPPILSLLCRELNERRFTEPDGTPEMPAPQITFSESDADVETIIKTFYERCLADRPEAVRMFIEEELVSYSGARLAQDEKSILSSFEEGWEIPGALDGRRAAGFGDAAKARACLKDLVNQRLLTPFGGGDNPSYELIHDLVAAVAEKSRTAREERVEKEQAGRRADAEKKAKENAEKQTRRAQRTAIAVSIALVVAVVAAVYGRAQYDSAKAAKDRAEEVIVKSFGLREKLQSIGQLKLLDDMNRNILEYYDSFAGEDKSPDILQLRSFALDGRADVLFAQSDLPEALKNYRESLAIREKFSKQDPGNADWQYSLAISYSRVGDVLRAQGDLAGALKNYRDSLAIREKFSKQDPSNADWQYSLAISYSSMGDVLRAQGDLAGALKNYRDSLAIAEKFSKQDPGNADWQGGLAMSYNNVGDVLRAQGDLAGALTNYRESLAIREKFSKQDPSNAGWQGGVAISYNNVGDVLRAQGDLAGALTNYRESLAIREKFSKQDPSNAGWQYSLAISYSRVGDVLRAQGDLAGALKNYSDSLAIAEKFSKQDPSNAGWQGGLAISYNNVGDVLRAQGDLAGALTNYRESLAIREKFSKQDPGNADWQGGVAISYNNVGDVLRAQGDLAGALKNYRDSLAIAEKFSKQDPSNADWQYSLAISYSRVGDVLRAQGDLAGALKNYRDSLAIREKFSKQDPSNADWQYSLAISYEGIGGVKRDQKDLVAALKSYRDSQAGMERLVKHDSSNAGWKRGFSTTYKNIGNVLRDGGDSAGALKNFNDGLAITEELLRQNSNNFDWQWDLSVWYAEIGKVLHDQGDSAGALKNYRDSLDIREKLAIRDPSNASWQAGLGWIYWQTGAVLEKVQPGSKGEGLAIVQKGHDILRQLREQKRLTVEHQKWLDESETDLGRMREANR